MDLRPGHRLTAEARPTEDEIDVLNIGLDDYNRTYLGDTGYFPVTLFVRNRTGAVKAGLDGAVYAKRLFVKLLWVDAALRGRGVGSELLARAEQTAAERGCHSAHLDTYSFQAPEFYKKFGYSEFGRIDYPPDHQRIFLQKSLVQG